jgi:hypothetical protein
MKNPHTHFLCGNVCSVTGVWTLEAVGLEATAAFVAAGVLIVLKNKNSVIHLLS